MFGVSWTGAAETSSGRKARASKAKKNEVERNLPLFKCFPTESERYLKDEKCPASSCPIGTLSNDGCVVDRGIEPPNRFRNAKILEK